jgi:hypothetical protein
VIVIIFLPKKVVVHHLLFMVHADQKTTLDLDDGIKVNYAKFGNFLAEVKTVTDKG